MSSGIGLFTYGTLAFPEVLHALAGRRFVGRPASIAGYRRYAVRGEVFPAIVAVPGSSLSGTLYGGLDRDTLRLLDRFEGDEYVRRRVSARTTGGAVISAFTYVLADRRGSGLGPEPWSPSDFAARHLAGYIRACTGFRRTSRGARSAGDATR